MIAGLKPYSRYKDSGVPWLADIPEHWAMERGRWLFRKMERPVRQDDEVVTCFRDGVVTKRSNRRVRGFTESLKVVFAREIVTDVRPMPVGAQATNEPDRDPVVGEPLLREPSVNQPGFGDRLNQGVRLLWGLAAAFKNPEELFDKRPRGSAMSQTVGKVPGVGTIGGWFDERGALKKAAGEAQLLLQK
jgi:hypothetical protein